MAEKKVTFGKIFWPSLLAAFIVSVVGLILWFVLLSSLFGKGPEFMVKENTVLHMTLNGQIGERGQTKLNPMSLDLSTKIGLADILHGFEAAKDDDRIKGIFMELNGVSCGYATAKEIRDAINRFEEESGKFVIAYNSGEVVTQKAYYIASAANKNYGFPSSNMEFLGLGAELSFFKNTLDNLDVEVQIIRGSDNHFKSAVEPFFLDKMSDSSRLQIERYMNSMWEDIRAEISADRGVSASELNRLADEALITNVTEAVEYKLIDEAKYRDEVMAIIKDKVKPSEGEVEYMSFAKFAKKRFTQNQELAKEDNPNIAVILAEGGVAKSGEGLTSDEICKLFKEVREDESIKTVVFRVNSPGGSALASDEIWREVELTNAKKKVIVSMGDVAASGGYYISAPATAIFAEPTTITGSIGVFGMIPYTGKLMEDKLGITFDRASTNKHSIITTNRHLTEEEMAQIQGQVDDIYDQFKGVVADGRGMTKEEVNVIGRGRVWTGKDAHKIGLVDELGGLTDAINYAAKESSIKDQKVLYYPNVKKDPLAEVLEQLNNEEGTSVHIEQNKLPEALARYYEQAKSLEDFQGVQMRMPFTIDVK